MRYRVEFEVESRYPIDVVRELIQNWLPRDTGLRAGQVKAAQVFVRLRLRSASATTWTSFKQSEIECTIQDRESG
jgi:hypothetical protein